MRRLVMVFVMGALLVSACGEDVEEPTPRDWTPTLLGMEVLDASCDIDGRFLVEVRLEGTGRVYCTEKCSGWPYEIEGEWVGTVLCGKGNDQIRLLCSDDASGAYAPRLDIAPGDRRYCY